MKAFLMYPAQDVDWQQPLPANAENLIQDLELETLFKAMALGDGFLFDVVQKTILWGASDLETIRYRQDILQDCLKNPAVVRAIYHIPIEAIENRRKKWRGIFSRYPGSILSGAIDLLEMYMLLLKKLKQIADQYARYFQSAGFTRFFRMIQDELSDDYFSLVQSHLNELKFNQGVFISAVLGKGNEGDNYILRKSPYNNRGWMERVFTRGPKTYSYTIHPRDQAGARALYELKDRGINVVANALAQSADHIESFLHMLRAELAFYIGCVNLSDRLTQLEAPITFPGLETDEKRRHTFRGLYDVCLALTMSQKIVGNEVDADHKSLVIITGANQGGKSTFLRSIGLSQLMMQCGMYVPAEAFYANACAGLFTHFKREEDVTMESGKLDEELGRMSDIVDRVTPNSMLLFNESFASTNEREGSEIARQIVSALLEKGIKVFFVTHLYEFANGFYDHGMANTLFLRAERKADGIRTFRLFEGEPLQTSYGADLYKQVFGTEVTAGEKLTTAYLETRT